jgi:23S rRNA pseudouridine1911/1915/1917 synthase
VYEDNHLLVINKPSGLTVHPGAGNLDKTLVNGLLARYGDTLSDIGGAFRPGIIHRLDKDTTGLMIVARTNKAHELLAQQIANREIERKYMALVYGEPFPLSGKIDKNIGRSKSNRLKMGVMKLGGRAAVTYYKTIKVYGDKALSMLECKLETGRTHQIRVHLDSQKNSVVGDKVYYSARNHPLRGLSAEAIEKIRGLGRQALHSHSIKFFHPILKTELCFNKELPDDISSVLSCIDL